MLSIIIIIATQEGDIENCLAHYRNVYVILSESISKRQYYFDKLQLYCYIASVPGLPLTCAFSLCACGKHSKYARGRPGMIHHVRVGQW